jgi:hypothetical protein
VHLHLKSYCPWLSKMCYFQLVWHIAQKVFDLGSWNFTGMLLWSEVVHVMFFACGFILFGQSYGPWLSKNGNFQFPAYLKFIWPRVMKFNRNVNNMLICAPGVLLVGFCFVRVIALDLVKICHFQLVLLEAQTIFDLESWNLIGMLVSMCNCAQGVWLWIYTVFLGLLPLN